MIMRFYLRLNNGKTELLLAEITPASIEEIKHSDIVVNIGIAFDENRRWLIFLHSSHSICIESGRVNSMACSLVMTKTFARDQSYMCTADCGLRTL